MQGMARVTCCFDRERWVSVAMREQIRSCSPSIVILGIFRECGRLEIIHGVHLLSINEETMLPPTLFAHREDSEISIRLVN
jgi:hypothetical protein